MQEPLMILVEDEFLIASNTGQILEDDGFAVVTAGSYEAARRVLEEPNERLAAIFLDINHRDGATGFDVARIARRRFPEVAVLYTSGLKPYDFDEQCVDGCQFIEKPYDTKAVVKILRGMTSQRSALPRRVLNGFDGAPGSWPTSKPSASNPVQ